MIEISLSAVGWFFAYTVFIIMSWWALAFLLAIILFWGEDNAFPKGAAIASVLVGLALLGCYLLNSGIVKVVL